MNNTAKGRRNEHKARKILESEGFLVEMCKHQKFGGNDFFGLWDIIAVKKGQILWVQVKTNRKPPKNYVRQLQKFLAPGKKQLWIFYDMKKLPRIFKINKSSLKELNYGRHKQGNKQDVRKKRQSTKKV